MAERSQTRYATMSVSEGKISGITPVFTDREHFGKLRLATRDNRDGTTDYLLESPMVFDRGAITTLLTEPLDIDGASWIDVQKGLKRISYPHRIVQRLSRSAGNLSHLHSIQHDAGTLAHSMQEHEIRSRNIPVFNYGGTRHYAAERLRELDKDLLKIIVEQLFGMTISSRMMRKWTPAQWSHRTPEQQRDLLHTFKAVLSGELTTKEGAISSEELLDCLMSAELEELEHIASGQLFERFTVEKDLAWNPDDSMGSPPEDIYVRDADIPPGVSRDKNTTVVLGGHLAPKNRKEMYDRRRVEFWTETPTRVIQPVLRWTRQGDGESATRIFRFGGGESHIQYDVDEPIVSYRSPLIGAAMAGIYLGNEEYSSELRQYFSVKKLSRQHAGFLPLVLNYGQDTVLDTSYIRQSERIIDQHAD